LKGFPTGTNEQGTPVVRYALAAGKSIKEGEVIYSETPLVASLFPELEGRFCNLCLKEIDAAEKVECPQCDVVAYCSKECLETATEEYHKHVCPQTKPKEGEEEATEDKTAVEFNELFKKNNTKYPIMIARFLSTMVAEEVKKAKETEKSEETTFGAWDHVDRFRYLETSPSEQTAAEIDMLKEALGPKVQGISEFLSNEIYLMLKGKLLYNAYAITTTKEDVVVEEAAEHMRTVDAEAKPIAAGLYKIATYLGQSQDEPNVKLSFQDNKLTVTALKDIDEDAELTADYTLPVPKKN
jgi:import receptor subunit TOM20